MSERQESNPLNRQDTKNFFRRNIETPSTKNRSQLLKGLLVVIGLLMAGCGGLAGDPVIVATRVVVTPTIEYPSASPDLALGASVFAEHCTRCHGIDGSGNGELIGTGAGKISNQPLSFRDAATTADKNPLMWYQMITSGNIEKQMPPWEKALSTEERWAVALYTYTLHNTAESIQAGSQLTDGKTITASDLPSLEQQYQLTDAALITQVGLLDAYLKGLRAPEKLNLAAYLRSLSLTNATHMGLVTSAPQVTAEPAVTPDVTPDVVIGTGTVSGLVTNGTAGSNVPTDLKVNLYVISAQGAREPIESTVGPDGRYTFEKVDIQANQRYLVTTTYKGRAYGSEAKTGDPKTNTLDLPISIYETTTDSSGLSIVAWVSQIQVIDNSLQITDFLQFLNSGDKAYSSDVSVDGSRFAGVQFQVPNDAEILSADATNPRYTVGADGHSVVDTAPVLPGEGYIFQMVYRVPYSGDRQIAQVIPYRVNGAYRLLSNNAGVSITSDKLKALGTQDLSGVKYDAYGDTLDLKAGGTVSYRVQGGSTASSTATGTPTNVISSNQLIPLILVTAGLVVMGMGVGVYLRGRKRSPAAETAAVDPQVLMDGLIRQIAELDISYKAGSLDEDTYQKRRGQLKARLAALMDQDEADSDGSA